MKRILSINVCFLLVLVPSFTSYSQSIPEDSLYLGQTPPGTTPKIFNLSISPGFFAAERVAISNDGKEIYYSELNGYSPSSKSRVKYYIYSEGKWNSPKILFEDFLSPALSVDGKTMFMQRIGNLSQEVWYSVRSDTVWSVPSRFMPSQAVDYMLWETNNGNLYFGSYSVKGGLGQRDWSKLIISGNDTTVQSLGPPLCTSGDDVDFGVSRNDSIIIIASESSTNRKAYGKSDLFISYKNDGSWTNAKNLGTKINVNDPNDGRWAPCITYDNKYLFYSGSWYSPIIYWVRVDNLIDSLKHTDFTPYVKNPIPNQTAFKDSSLNYQIPDSTFIDDDGNSTLSYTATLSNGSSLPVWLSFNPVTHTFSGTPDTVTVYNVKVTATDTAGASASSTFRITVTNPPSSIGEEKDRLPKGFMLNQNYPNPFNPTTVIGYKLPVAGNVKISIYNLLGQKIKTLVNSFQSAGEHSIVWDATDERNNPISSGIYIYKFETEIISFQKKMVLIR